MTKLEKQIAVLNLRASSESGGGPENIIFKFAESINTDRFWFGICYLRKKDVSIFNIAKLYEERGYHFYELAGGVIDFRLFKSLVRLIRTHKIDIVHAHDPKTYVYAYLLGFVFPDVKLVATLHGWVHRRARSSFYSTISNFVLKKFNAVIAVSRDLEKRAARAGISNIHMVHNAIDTDKWKPDAMSDKNGSTTFIIAYIGRLSKEKGPIDFVKAAKGIIERDQGCRFIVAGDGPLLESTKQYVQSLEILQYFDFKGNIPQKNMPAIYGEINVVLSSSHTEGMPVALLEALATGVPVVATEVGGVGELIRHGYNGLLTEKKDIESLISNVLLLKNTPELAQTLKRNGRDAVTKKFSYSHWTQKMESLYVSLSLEGRQ
ncbi:glycosyltransferase family 4 protein [uncultured Desulfobacter sp.]|uniref:glycosyltransferase family 4 protein n=1 Tax=uncultured Desulfobacter sp. TaxID=240139 RepID=UPI002AA73631|nr:glycosyltransferase family 4 protein [uncultured Desulfobacter sp.]